jgi:hypothetical protein
MHRRRLMAATRNWNQPPFEYRDQPVNPTFDPNVQQWEFWSEKKWIPLYESGC